MRVKRNSWDEYQRALESITLFIMSITMKKKDEKKPQKLFLLSKNIHAELFKLFFNFQLFEYLKTQYELGLDGQKPLMPSNIPEEMLLSRNIDFTNLKKCLEKNEFFKLYELIE